MWDFEASLHWIRKHLIYPVGQNRLCIKSYSRLLPFIPKASAQQAALPVLLWTDFYAGCISCRYPQGTSGSSRDQPRELSLFRWLCKPVHMKTQRCKNEEDHIWILLKSLRQVFFLSKAPPPFFFLVFEWMNEWMSVFYLIFYSVFFKKQNRNVHWSLMGWIFFFFKPILFASLLCA